MQAMRAGRARFGFGCVRLGSASAGGSWRAHVRLVERAIDEGITTFDTADAYGSGVSERIVGKAVHRRRAEVQIATKSGYLFTERSLAGQSAARAARSVAQHARRQRPGSDAGSSGGGTGSASYERQDFSPGYLRKAIESSLRRLDTDYIDVLQLHGPRQVVPGIIDEVDQLKAAGKIRRFGVGAESLASAKAWLQVAGVDTLQVPFGVLDPQAATEIFPLAVELGVDVWVRGVLGGGLLSLADAGNERVRSDDKFPLIQDLAMIARRADVSVSRLAVDFVRSFPEVSTVLIGIQSDRHLDDNLAIMDAPPIEQSVIDEVYEVLARWVGDHEQL